MKMIVLFDYLPDGKYRTHGKLAWHERLRLKLAILLYNSVKRPDIMEIPTKAGASPNLIKNDDMELCNDDTLWRVI